MAERCLTSRAVRRDAGDARDEADQQDTPAPGQRGQRLVEQGAADRVIDHIHPAPVREFGDPRLQAFGAVVDALVRAVPSGEREAFRAARRRDYRRAERLAAFDRRQPDAARRAQHQHGLAGLEVGLPADRDMRGNPGGREGGGHDVGHALRHVEGFRFLRNGGFGIAAPPEDRHDAVAHGQPLAAGPERRDFARRLQPRHEGQGRPGLVVAGDHDRIGEIDAGGGDADRNLAVAGRRRGHVADFEAFDLAPGGADGGAHGYGFP